MSQMVSIATVHLISIAHPENLILSKFIRFSQFRSPPIKSAPQKTVEHQFLGTVTVPENWCTTVLRYGSLTVWKLAR